MPRITPSEAFVETLVAHDVKHVFGIVGSAYMDALDLFPAAGIRFISVAHEQGAAHMADGYARASGKHGVCIGQNGPGVTNFVTAIAAAYWAHSPVVAITPQAGSNGMGLGGFQETDQMPIFSQITKYQAHVNSPQRIGELTHRAFELAKTENGPTQVNIPRDHFYGEFEAEIPQPLGIERTPGGPESIAQAAELIRKAKFPVIVSGGGVIMANAVPSVVSFAEYLNAPVVSSYLHNDSFPHKHKLACGPLGYQGSKAAMKLISQADVVIAIGTRLGPFGTLPQHGIDYWPENAKIVQIDVEHRRLGLTKKIDVGICGDAGLATQAIQAALKNGSDPACLGNTTERIATISAEQEAWHKELSTWGQGEGTPMAPRRALLELQKALPDNAMVTTDIGNVCSVANSYLSFEQGRSFFAAMSFGNCGYALPTAIGAKVACPDRPAIAYVGDGAWCMSLLETFTSVRENIPVTAVVFNNGQWGAEKRNQIDFYSNRFVGTNLENPSFAEIAKAMGANGIRVDTPDAIGDAIKTATSADKMTVVEVMLTEELGEPFRRDALKKPVRLLDKYKSLT